MKLLTKFAARIKQRAPDFIIGGEDDPYLLRWFVLPRNPVFNLYLHEFRRSDDDRALHDHPYLFNCSVIVEGWYFEHAGGRIRLRRPGEVKFRWGRSPHRVELLPGVSPSKNGFVPCTTFFFTGPRVRQWGFYCPQGWVHWKKFTASHDKGAIGKGCDQ